MDWIVTAYRSQSGRRLVDLEIAKLPATAQGKLLRQIALLGLYGPDIRPPHVKQVERGLFELRILGADNVRLLFCVDGRTIVLLHAFNKKTQKLPPKALRIARSRRSDLKPYNTYVIL